MAAGAAVLGLAAYLLWPLPSSPRWDIGADEALLQGKRRYLDALAARPADNARPNVLLILADDLGRDELGSRGAVPAITPHIDRLAREGVSFTSAYATAAICAPSRAALLTGRYQNRFGFESQPMQRYVRSRLEYLAFRYLIDTDAMQPFLLDAYPDELQRAAQGLPPSEISIAEVLAAAGYDTAILGKWHLGYSALNHPSRFGFQEQYGFLEAFTLYAPRGAPHIVEHRHDLFWERHIYDMGRSGPSAIQRNGQPLEEPRYLTDAIAAETLRFIDTAAARGRSFFAFASFSAPHTPFQALAEDYQALDAAIGDPNRRVYLALIRRLDHAVGALVEHLARRGMLDQTLIVFASDNGTATYTEAGTNGALRGGKFTQFEGGLAVPLILRGPGFCGGIERAEPVLLSDLFATILTPLGIDLPSDRHYDSQPLQVRGDPERALFWRSDFNRTIRLGGWKLMQNRRTGSLHLYDLTTDPAEEIDLAPRRPELVADFLTRLDAWESELEAPLWPRVMNYQHVDPLGSDWFAI